MKKKIILLSAWVQWLEHKGAKRTVDVRVGKYFKESIKNSYKPSESEEKENASDKKPKRTKKSTKSDK